MQGKPGSILLNAIFIIMIIFSSCGEDKPEQLVQKDSSSNRPPKRRIPINKSADVIVMDIWILGGDHNYDLIIGADSQKVEDEYDSTSTYKDSVDKMFEVHKHLLSKEAVAYIDQYVKGNCVPDTGQPPKGEHFFYIIRSNTIDKSSTVCCVENKESGIAYFSSLIEQLEQSPYREECRYLIGDIRAKFIEGKPFPFTPYQQRLFDSAMQKRKTKRSKN